MKKVREQAKRLCELYSKTEFEDMLSHLDLKNEKSHFAQYIEKGIITPIHVEGKPYYHTGHLLILLRFRSCSDLRYIPVVMKDCDLEDILSRRIYWSEYIGAQVLEDSKSINAFYAWLFGEEMSSLNPQHIVHTKAMFALLLDDIDPQSIYENLHLERSGGIVALVQDLIQMQSEISAIVGLASDAGAIIPSVQHIYERTERNEELREMMMTLQSPFLAIPTREMMVEERLDFIRKRNDFLAKGQYRELIEFYESNTYLFESEVERHAALCVCIGHIYGDLLKDNAKAADAFREAMDYDTGNREAFAEVSRHLRAAENWNELIELLSNHWDTLEDADKRCALILECAQIQAFKCQNIEEALGLYERCMLEGYPGNVFDELYRIVAGLMEQSTDLEKLRAMVTLTMHIVNYAQCDKVEGLLNKIPEQSDGLGQCLVKLVEAGMESFKGDQPSALEILRDAIVCAPNTNLIDGVLLRIASKMVSENEFREGIDELESESLSQRELGNIWLRVARVLAKLKDRTTLALEYGERAVSTNGNNSEAIDFCYDLSQKIHRPDRALIYAILKSSRCHDAEKKSELDKICTNLRQSLSDDEEKLTSVYETLLQFEDVKMEVGDSLRDLMLSVDDDKAVTILQRVESRCIAAGMSQFVGELYQSVLERDISADLKKGVLERYVGFLYGQRANMDIDVFVAAHAELYVLMPSDRLLTMIKNVAQDTPSIIRTWTEVLEDALPKIEDTTRVIKIQMALAGCYQSMLKDPQKAAESFANILELAPDNVPIFKCCYSSYERLERYFDCVEIARTFPMDKLSPQDRLTYCVKSLSYALIQLLDGDAMEYFIHVISQDDETVIPVVLTQLLKAAQEANVDMAQVVCFLEQIEKNASGMTALAVRIKRAWLLVSQERFSEAIELLDEKTYEAVNNTALKSDAIVVVSRLNQSDEDCQKIVSLWSGNVENPAQATKIPSDHAEKMTASEPVGFDDARLATWMERIGEESLPAEVEAATTGLPAEKRTEISLKLAVKAEEAKAMPQAETFYKQAFAYTQSYELLEYYKRNRQFKRALKVSKFKVAKSSDADKAQAKLEMCMIYEQLGDNANACNVLEDILSNRDGLEATMVVSLMRRLATNLSCDGRNAEAIEVLSQASSLATKGIRDEIDIDRCFLMREENDPNARKLYIAIKLRNCKIEKMELLSLCFDIDMGKYVDARKKIQNLLNGDNLVMKTSALEKQIELEKKVNADASIIRGIAEQLLALSPDNDIAKAVLS